MMRLNILSGSFKIVLGRSSESSGFHFAALIEILKAIYKLLQISENQVHSLTRLWLPFSMTGFLSALRIRSPSPSVDPFLFLEIKKVKLICNRKRDHFVQNTEIATNFQQNTCIG